MDEVKRDIQRERTPFHQKHSVQALLSHDLRGMPYNDNFLNLLQLSKVVTNFLSAAIT